MSTEEFVQAAAGCIAARLTLLMLTVVCDDQDAEGGKHLSVGDVRQCVCTWKAAGKRMGLDIHLYHAPGEGEGEYCPILGDGERGVVVVNTAYPEEIQCLVLAHELAHHAIIFPDRWLESLVTEAGHSLGPLTRHLIAKHVERMIFQCGKRVDQPSDIPELVV